MCSTLLPGGGCTWCEGNACCKCIAATELIYDVIEVIYRKLVHSDTRRIRVDNSIVLCDDLRIVETPLVMWSAMKLAKDLTACLKHHHETLDAVSLTLPINLFCRLNGPYIMHQRGLT